MSVINDMLNDLEQRQSPQHPSLTGSDYQNLSAVAPNSNSVRYLWWLLGLLAMAVIAWLGWRNFSLIVSHSHALTGTVQTPAELTTVIEPAVSILPAKTQRLEPTVSEHPQVEPEAPADIALSRIEIDGHAELYILDMTFSQVLTVPLLHFRKGDRIWLRLFSAADSKVELPTLPENTPIHGWQSYLEDGYQMITLRVDPLVDAELIRLNSTQWRLVLQPQAIDNNTESELTHESPEVIAPVSKQTPAKQKQRESLQPAMPVVKKSKHRVKAAAAALAKGESKQAEDLLKEVLTLQPDHLQASQLLGRLYLEDGRAQTAEAVVLTALQHHPQQPELISYFARSLLGQGRLGAAAEYLSRAMHQEHAPHLGLMAVIRQRQGEHREASRFYQLALQQKPDEVTWLTGLGISQEHLQELTAARQAYERSLATGKLSVALRGFVQERLETLKNFD